MNFIPRLLALNTILILFSSCVATVSETGGFVGMTGTIAGGWPGLRSTDSIVARVVTDGVMYRHIVRRDGPWNIHFLTIDLKKMDIDITSARALDSVKGRETTSSIAKRTFRGDEAILAAMNADFFNMETGENDLNQVIEGEIVKGVKKPVRPQFAVGYSRTPYIEKFVFEGTAISPAAQFPLDGVITPGQSRISSLIIPCSGEIRLITRGGRQLTPRRFYTE